MLYWLSDSAVSVGASIQLRGVVLKEWIRHLHCRFSNSEPTALPSDSHRSAAILSERSGDIVLPASDECRITSYWLLPPSQRPAIRQYEHGPTISQAIDIAIS